MKSAANAALASSCCAGAVRHSRAVSIIRCSPRCSRPRRRRRSYISIITPGRVSSHQPIAPTRDRRGSWRVRRDGTRARARCGSAASRVRTASSGCPRSGLVSCPTSGARRLIRAVGEPRARELILTGRLVRAHTAERYGLVHEVDLVARPARYGAGRAARRSPSGALGLAKALCQVSADADAATSFRVEGIVQQALLGQPELMKQLPAGLAFIKAQVANAK